MRTRRGDAPIDDNDLRAPTPHARLNQERYVQDADSFSSQPAAHDLPHNTPSDGRVQDGIELASVALVREYYRVKCLAVQCAVRLDNLWTKRLGHAL